MSPDHIRRLLDAVRDIRPDEIGCDTCYEQLDRFAEATLAGRSAAEVMPLVEDHLARCPECREEFEALLDALHAIEG